MIKSSQRHTHISIRVVYIHAQMNTTIRTKSTKVQTLGTNIWACAHAQAFENAHALTTMYKVHALYMSHISISGYTMAIG